MRLLARRQNKQAEQAYYDRYGEEFGDPFPETLYERWFRLCGLWEGPPLAILEAACGAGHFGRRLAERGHRVTGVDLSPVMVEIANRNAPAGFKAVVGDLEDPHRFSAQQFDAIFFGQALHHFPDPEPVLNHCVRWLRPGGRLMLIEPNGSNPVNAVGKWIGRLLALHPACAKTIGTVNEVSLPVGWTVRALRRRNLLIELEQMEAILPSDEASDGQPWVLRVLGGCRQLLYRWCLKMLPPRLSGIQFIVVARCA